MAVEWKMRIEKNLFQLYHFTKFTALFLKGQSHFGLGTATAIMNTNISKTVSLRSNITLNNIFQLNQTLSGKENALVHT